MDVVSRQPIVPGVGSLAVVAVLGALAARWLRPRGLAVPACVSLIALVATRAMYDQHPAWQAVYGRLFLAFPLLAAAALMGRIPLAPRWGAVLAPLTAAVCFFGGLPTARSRTTDDDEFRAVRPWIRALPAGCRAFYVARAGRRVDVLPEYLVSPSARETFVRISDQDRDRIAAAATGCVYVFHTSLCSTPDGAPLCRALEAMPLRSVERARLPARPSYAAFTYDGPDVPIAVLEACSPGKPGCGSAPAE
jgi:hypothetical protein